MDEQVRHGMLANIGILIAFRSAADDVAIVQREFAGRFRPEILMGLDVGECVVKSGRELPRIVRLKNDAP
jgi:hypothetical protein